MSREIVNVDLKEMARKKVKGGKEYQEYQEYQSTTVPNNQ